MRRRDRIVVLNTRPAVRPTKGVVQVGVALEELGRALSPTARVVAADEGGPCAREVEQRPDGLGVIPGRRDVVAHLAERAGDDHVGAARVDLKLHLLSI